MVGPVDPPKVRFDEVMIGPVDMLEATRLSWATPVEPICYIGDGPRNNRPLKFYKCLDFFIIIFKTRALIPMRCVRSLVFKGGFEYS